jgi:integrase
LQLVSMNAATLVKVPKPKARPITPLTLDQAKAFLAVTSAHRLGALFSVALACGLRLGEATGLRWEDVDRDTGEVRIRQQLQVVGKRLVLQELKTAKSRRTLVLPDVCLKALRHSPDATTGRAVKSGRGLDRRDEFGVYHLCPPWQRAEGGHAAPSAERVAHPACVAGRRRSEMPRMRFHDLRHSAASLLIADGVELVEVSMLLGHSELRVTADLYSHLQKQTAAEAARQMDRVLNRQEVN